MGNLSKQTCIWHGEFSEKHFTMFECSYRIGTLLYKWEKNVEVILFW